MSLHNLYIVFGMALVYLVSAKVGKRVGIPSRVIDEIAIFVMVPGLFLSLLVARLLFHTSGASSFSYMLSAILLLTLYLIFKGSLGGRLECGIFKLVDVLTFSSLCGWVLVRIGCAVAHDYLAPASSASWYTVNSGGLAFHNLALYEALLTLLFLLPVAHRLLVTKTINSNSNGGELFVTLWILYGIIRFFLEMNRSGQLHYGMLAINQYASLILILVSLLIALYMPKVPKKFS